MKTLRKSSLGLVIRKFLIEVFSTNILEVVDFDCIMLPLKNESVKCNRKSWNSETELFAKRVNLVLSVI